MSIFIATFSGYFHLNINMEEKKKELPASELVVEIGSNSYTIKFPIKTGVLIDIEALKINSSNGSFKDMIYGGESAKFAWLLVQAISTFTYLIPDLQKHLLVPSLYDLDIVQSKSLIKAYKKFAPWYQEWQDTINESLNEE